MQTENSQLLKLAAEAAKNAYAPYSKFFVGACVLFRDGGIYTGCNVENASYGLTLCAERNAISSGIAAGSFPDLQAVAIYSPNEEMCFPCGACRQWIAEFSNNAEIILQKNSGEIIVYNIQELLPNSFKLK